MWQMATSEVRNNVVSRERSATSKVVFAVAPAVIAE